MSNPVDDMPPVSASEADKPEDFRLRKRERETEQADPVEDEGMPPINRRKGSNKTVTAMFLLSATLLGCWAIWYLNFGGKNKVVVPPPAATAQNQQPKIDFSKVGQTPRPPADPGANAGPVGGALQGSASPPRGTEASTPPSTGKKGEKPISWMDRKLSGDVVVKKANAGGNTGNSGGNASKLQGGRVPDYEQAENSQGNGGSGGGVGGQSNGSLGAQLEPTRMKGVSASLLMNRDYLVTKGTPIDCTLGVAINTAQPGLLTCTTSTAVYSDNRQVVLMEAGTVITGEQRGNVKNGQASVFGLFDRAKTPNGVVVNLNSPGADGLGRSGLPGWVDTHFAERFGAAGMFLVLKSSLDLLIAQNQENPTATVISDNSSEGEGIVTKILDSTMNIPNTVIKNQGDQITIMVARDLDFSGVYGLEVSQ